MPVAFAMMLSSSLASVPQYRPAHYWRLRPSARQRHLSNELCSKHGDLRMSTTMPLVSAMRPS